MKVREFGSDFQKETRAKWLLDSQSTSSFLFNDALLVTSGREALLGILKLGIKKYQWTTIYFPSYYCHEVVDYISDLPLTINYYHYNPFLNTEPDLVNILDVNSSVFVNVNFFGLKELDTSFLLNAFILDDYTYKIASYKDSKAHFCFGSLRKELPVPLGGFCYSPKKLTLPEFKKQTNSNAIVSKKLMAMQLKNEYLKGKTVEKDIFRDLYLKGELLFEKHNFNGLIDDSTSLILQNLHLTKIFKKKNENINKACDTLDLKKVNIFNIQVKLKGYGLILLFKSLDHRNFVKSNLIKTKIYPAVLWPDQRHKFATNIAEKMLLIHLDYRHSLNDVYYICKKIEEICNEL